MAKDRWPPGCCVATIRAHMADLSNWAATVWGPGADFVSRSRLRWEFASIATAIALLAAALGAIALYFFRRKTRDLTLIYFGLFCALWAVRLLMLQPSFRS